MAHEVGFGILGCGNIGESHAQGIRNAPLAKLVAVADAAPERAKVLADKFGCKWYDSPEAMLQDGEVEAVNVCTPSGMHADHGLTVAQAGRHVLLEKPMDRNLAKVDRLIAYCREHHLKLGCVFQSRFTESVRQVKQAIDEGRLGRLVSASAEAMWYRSQEYYDSGAWRGTLALDGGCLWNQAIHYIDLLVWMLGKPKQVLSAHLATIERKMEAESLGFAQVLFENGAVGCIRATTVVHPGLPSRLEICGTKGTAVLLDNELVLLAIEGEESRGKAETQVGSGAAADPLALHYSSHTDQIQDFAEAIRSDREPFVNGIEGRRVVELLTMIYRAAGIEP